MRGFIGIDLARESVPDATTLLKFRRLLEEHQLTAAIFGEINAYLAERGLMLREGTMVVGPDADPGSGHSVQPTAAKAGKQRLPAPLRSFRNCQGSSSEIGFFAVLFIGRSVRRG